MFSSALASLLPGADVVLKERAATCSAQFPGMQPTGGMLMELSVAPTGHVQTVQVGVQPAGAKACLEHQLRGVAVLNAGQGERTIYWPLTVDPAPVPTPMPFNTGVPQQPIGMSPPVGQPIQPAPIGVSATPPVPQLESTASNGAAPTISTSRGTKGGVVVLWPRIVPRTDDPNVLAAASAIHQRAAAIARETSGHVDVRPNPQRVCPQAGCQGSSLGSVIVHTGTGMCAVAAWVAAPGRSQALPVPWSPGVETKVAAVKFREPVESALSITDFRECSSVVNSLQPADGHVRNAIGQTVQQAR